LIRIRDVIVPGNHGFGTEGALGTRDSAARAPAELVLLSEPCTSLLRTSHDCELVGSPVASAVRLTRELWERGTRSQQSNACRSSCRSDDAAHLVTSHSVPCIGQRQLWFAHSSCSNMCCGPSAFGQPSPLVTLASFPPDCVHSPLAL